MESAIAAERAYQIGERDKAVAHEKKINLTEKEKELWQQRMEHESELADQREKMIQAIKDHDTRLRAEMDDQRAELNELHIKERKELLKRAEEKALIEKLDLEE
jgi:hypothetical protein